MIRLSRVVNSYESMGVTKMCDAKIVKGGKIVATVYACGGMVVVKSCKTGKLQEFSSISELKARLEPMGCKLVGSYSQLAGMQKLAS